MPSRRPPSQRDPAYALHRLLGRIEQAVPGLKVKNAAPIPKPPPARRAEAQPATGGADGEHNGTGSDSTAVGTGAVAPGAQSTAVGDLSSSSNYATAVGYGATAYINSVAVGQGAVTGSGDQGVVIGASAETDSTQNTVVGYGANILGATNSVTIGGNSWVDGNSAVAVGYSAHAAVTGVAIGQHARANGTRTGAIGNACTNTRDDNLRVRFNDLEVAASNGTQTRLILVSPSGTRWAISVDNSGVISAALA